MKYRFAAPALDEYERAAEYYENCEAGLGTEFVRAVDEEIAFVLEFPKASPRISTPVPWIVRKRLLRRFPIALCYVVKNDTAVTIIAVAHGNRRPGYWLRRLHEL